jgi:hypothetical protein
MNALAELGVEPHVLVWVPHGRGNVREYQQLFGSNWKKIQGACPTCGGRDLREAPRDGGLWCFTCCRRLRQEAFTKTSGPESAEERKERIP